MLKHSKNFNFFLKFSICSRNKIFPELQYKKTYELDKFDNLETAIHSIGGEKTEYITDYIDNAFLTYSFDNKGKLEIFINEPWFLHMSSDNKDIFEKIISIIEKK